MILLRWQNKYSICLISFFNLYELFPAIVRANNIGCLVNSLLVLLFLILFLHYFFCKDLVLLSKQ